MPAPITVTRSGTGWTVDVTALELSASLVEKDFAAFTTTAKLSNADFTKTSQTVLTYSGTSLSTTAITFLRITDRDIDLLQFAEAVSDVGMNQRIQQIEKRLDDLLFLLSQYNPQAPTGGGGGGGGTVSVSEVITSDINPIGNPSVDQRLYFRHNNGSYWVSNGATWSGEFLPFTSPERTKLSGIAAGATVNSSDVALLSRSNHTGVQSFSTIDINTTGVLLGRSTAGTGATELITLGGNLTLTAGVLNVLAAPTFTGLTLNATAAVNINNNFIGFGQIINNAGNSGNRQGLEIVAGTTTGATQFLRLSSNNRSATADFSMTSNVVSLNRPFIATIFRPTSYTIATLPSTGQSVGDYAWNSDNALGARPVVWSGTAYRPLAYANENLYVEANRSTTQSIPGSATTTVIFSTEVTDTGNQYDPTTGQLVITTGNAGVYVFSSTVTLSSLAANASFALAIFKNSTEYRVAQDDYLTGSFPVLSGCIPVNCAVGDVITARIVAFNAGSFSTIASTPAGVFLSAVRV